MATLTNDWKLWLTTAPVDGWPCDALQFIMANDDRFHVANKIEDRPSQVLRHENGYHYRYFYLPFTVSRPGKRLNAEYMLNVQMAPAPSDLIETLVSLTTSQIRQIVQVEHRVYLLPNDVENPVSVVPTRLLIGTITTARAGITITCIPPALTRKRAGQVYTLEEFSGLARY